MTAARHGSSNRRLASLAAAFSLTVSLVVIPAHPSLAATDTYLDNFDAGFSGNDGKPFATDWLESGESDGPGTGGIKVEIEPHCASGPCLTLGRLATGGGNVSVEREIDLSLASSATLQFDFKRHDHPGVSGQVALEVSADGGGGWDPLQTWDLSVTDPAPAAATFDISSHLSVDTRIRFRLISDTDQSHFNVDNLVITAENDLSPYKRSIVINEILSDATSSPTNQEQFVELFNATSGPIALDGWELQSGNGSTFYTFPIGVALGPDEYAVVWTRDLDVGGLRDAPAAAFQDGAGKSPNFLSETGDAVWLLDSGGARVDFVAWGTGITSPPPEWDGTYETSIGDGDTAQGQSISLTPNGVDGNTSACWEPTTSGGAAGRCTGFLPTSDVPPAAQLWSPGFSNQTGPSNQPPLFDQDLLDRSDAEGTLISVSSGATDPDIGDTLTYTATGLPPGLSIDPGSGLITGTISFTATGTHSVEITTTDNGIPNLTDLDTFTWTITEVNQAPVFDQDLLDRSDAEGTLISLSAAATDPDLADTLTYTATGLPEGISLDTASGLISGALGPNAAGSHPVTITVTDNGIPNLTDIDTFTWTVNAGEVAYLVANNGGGNGGDDQLTAVDLSDPNPASNEINIGTGTGTTNIESIALQPGTDTLFAIENNQLGTIDLTTGVFTALPSIVGSGNGPAGLITFDNIESLTFNPFTGDLYATHRRGLGTADLLFLLDPVSGAVIPGAFGGNTYVPLQIQFPYHHAADLAFDPTDGQLYGIHWDLTGPTSIAVIDPDTGTTATVGPIPWYVAGLAFDAGGRLWATTADTFSPYFLYEFDKTNASVISTTTIDNAANYESIAISFPFEPNQAPTFDQDLLDRSDAEGTLISVSSGATDPDIGDTLTYTATGLPPGLSIDPGSGLITGTISFTATGTHSVEITTTDNGIPNLTDLDTFTWTITEVNQAPVFDQDLLDRSDAEGTLISLSAAATDPDLADTLTYTATGLPEGISLDTASGLISGALGPNAAGSHPVTITVTDNGIPNLTDIDTFTWTVNAGEVAYLVANNGGGNGGDDQLTAVDLSDPNPASNEINIGTGTGTTNIESIALQPGTDTLFAIENNQLGTIDLTTGVFTALPSIVGSGNGPAGLITFDNIESLTFNPFTGDLYATHRRGDYNEDLLFRIDPATGAVIPGMFGGNDYTPIEQAGLRYHIADMAFDPTDGQLYGIHWTLLGSFWLATIDPATGATTTIGVLPSNVTGLAQSDTGGLWGTTADTFSPYFLYEFDKTNASVISTTTIDNAANYESIAISFPFNPNLPPVFDQNLLDRSDPEGTLIGLSAAGTDPDAGDVLLYTATGLPPGLSIDPGSGLITGTISFTATGTHSVEITTTDNGIPNLTDLDTFTWTITEVNQAPVFDQDLLDRSDAEGTLISLSAAATDPDLADTLTYTATGLPAGLTIDPGSGLIAGTLTFTASGTYPITITVSDDGIPNLTDIDTFTWTVANTNRAPVIVNPGAQTTPELAPFTLLITASDPDFTIPGFGDGGTLPAWATLTDNLDGTATISGTPGGGDSATTTVTISADDGLLSDDAVFDLTVTNTNLAPVIVNPGDQSGAENTPFTLTVSATDPDTTIPNFTATGLPAWATLTDNADGTATIAGTPGFDDAGITTVTVTADDGDLTDDATFTITITNTNRAPIVDPIPDVSVAEADPLTPIGITATDPDLTIPALTAAGLPAWATFTDNADGTATITGTPGYTDANTHLITITATDGSLTDDTTFRLTITNTNRPPVVAPIADQSVAEADPFLLVVSASDPDLTVPFLNVSGLPAWASFTDNLDGTATITGTPGYTDANTHLITITATDDGPLSATETFDLTVTNTNLAPVIVNPGDQSGAENTPFTLTVSATDPDTTIPNFTATGLPAWATLTDNADGTATIAGTPGFDDAGITTVTVTADDGDLTDDATFTITITNTNRAPIVDPIPDVSVAEADPLTPIGITATDPDLTIPALTAAGLPAWATFTDNADGTATITGTPGYTDANTHLITITATDGSLTDDTTFRLTITNTNRPPVVAPIADQSVAEADPFLLVVSASDPDLTVPFLNVSGLPAWASFTDNLDGTATITGTPGYTDANTHLITITATDDGPLSATETFDLTVTNTNLAPVIVNPGDQSGAENTPFTLTVSATDPDTTIPNFTATGLPAWATLTDNADGTATIAGTPGFDDAGITTVTVTADDGDLTDDATFTITITNTNRAPIVDPIPDVSVAEADPLTPIGITATDPDLTIPALTAAGLPAWATFTDNADGTATITGTPGYTDANTHLITITATDGSLTDDTTFRLTITNTNRPPSITDPGPQTAAEGALHSQLLLATDPDGDPVAFSDGGTLPAWATLADNGDNTATLSGTPGYDDAGATPVTITVTDGPFDDAATFTITVGDTNRPPVADPVADQSVAEADPLSLTVTATDPDLTIPALSAAGLPAWASFTDNADGTATITGTPGYTDANTHLITITADDGDLTDDATFTITITNTNRAPIVDPIPDVSVAEADPLTPIGITATDPDLTIPALTAAGLPAWATFTDNADGTATITGTPGYDDAASSLITITITDGSLTDDTTFRLTIANTNRPPKAEDDALLLPSGAVSTVFSVLINDTDPDDDDLVVVSFDYSGTGTLSDEGGGTFRYAPGSDAPYAETFTYTIEDPAGADATATVFVSVSAPAAVPALPPVLVPALIGLGPLSGVELRPVYFTAAVTVEADVTFSLIGAPHGSAIDPATGSFFWTPTEADGPGAFSFVVRLADADTGAVLDETTIDLAIAEADSPPTIHSTGLFTAEAGSVFTTVLIARDPDLPAQTPRFEWSGPAPAGASIDPRTGEITWTVPATQPTGRQELGVRVRDEADPGLFDEVTVVVTIGATSSSERKATLIAQLIPPADSSRASTPVPRDDSIPRTLVIMARAGMGSARALGTPLILLVVLALFMLSVGRISLHPLLGRSRRMEGMVAWFDERSGYGFILPDDSTAELFLHRGALARGRTDVMAGERVSFRMVKGGQRSFALRVKGVE